MFYEYWDNKKIHLTYKEELKLKKERLERRESHMKHIKTNWSIIRPHDFYTSGNTIIDEGKEIAFWFDNNK